MCDLGGGTVNQLFDMYIALALSVVMVPVVYTGQIVSCCCSPNQEPKSYVSARPVNNSFNERITAFIIESTPNQNFFNFRVGTFYETIGYEHNIDVNRIVDLIDKLSHYGNGRVIPKPLKIVFELVDGNAITAIVNGVDPLLLPYISNVQLLALENIEMDIQVIVRFCSELLLLDLFVCKNINNNVLTTIAQHAHKLR